MKAQGVLERIFVEGEARSAEGCELIAWVLQSPHGTIVSFGKLDQLQVGPVFGTDCSFFLGQYSKGIDGGGNLELLHAFGVFELWNSCGKFGAKDRGDSFRRDVNRPSTTLLDAIVTRNIEHVYLHKQDVCS